MEQTARLALWLPWVIAAHVFSLVWVLKTFLISRTKRLSSAVLGPQAHAHIPDACIDSDLTTPIDQSTNRDATIVISDQKVPGQCQHVGFTDVEILTTDVESSFRLGTATASCASGAPLEATMKAGKLAYTGQLLGQSLQWETIGCTYKVHGVSKVVLQDVWGKAYPGEMQALMGPSGAGKSTLMDILAMRKTTGKITGRLLLDGKVATKSFVNKTAYIPQDDNFVPTMTAVETLEFYASLTLPSDSKSNRIARNARIQHVLTATGISHVQGTLVGGILPGGLMLRGLSGGERRRLTIATRTLAVPGILFLDEPTSGLDSFAALSVMGHLQRMAENEGLTILCSIHQPRSAIWEMFDRVTLLSCGRLMYHGPCSSLSPWFNSLGYNRLHGHEADWALDLVAIGFDKPLEYYGHTMRCLGDVHAAADAFRTQDIEVQQGLAPQYGTLLNSTPATKDRISSLSSNISISAAATEPEDSSNCDIGQVALRDASDGPSACSRVRTFLREFLHLLKREALIITRNPFDVAGRTLTCTWLGIIWGIIFYNTPANTLEGMRTRVNLIAATLVNCTLLPFVSISLYTADKKFYLADASAKLYKASSYYLAKVVATTPFNAFGMLCYVMVLYGMAGLRPGLVHVAKFGCLAILLYLIAIQVLHLFAIIAPNQDITLCLMVVWTAFNMVLSSFYINFNEVTTNKWFTHLHYLSAVYYATEAEMVNELQGAMVDCSGGMDQGLLDLIRNAVPSMSDFQKSVLGRLGSQQPGCQIDSSAMLQYFEYNRPFGTSVAALVAYLGALHVLTYLALVTTARKEAR